MNGKWKWYRYSVIMSSHVIVIDWTTLGKTQKTLHLQWDTATRIQVCRSCSATFCWSELESKWIFNFQLLSRRIGALTVASKTFGDSACLGTFQRWHCKHNQNLRDTTVTEGQMMVWHSHQWSNVFEAKAFAVCPFTVLHLSCSVALSRSVRRTWHRSIVVIMQFLRLLVARIFEVYPLWSICCHV